MRDQVDGKSVGCHGVDGQADAVDGDRALARDLAAKLRRKTNRDFPVAVYRFERCHFAAAIDVAAHQMAAEPV